MCQVTVTSQNRVLLRQIQVAGAVGIVLAVSALVWVLTLSETIQGSLKGVLVAIVGIATTTCAVVSTLAYKLIRPALIANAAANVLMEASAMAEFTPPQLRLIEPPGEPHGQSS